VDTCTLGTRDGDMRKEINKDLVNASLELSDPNIPFDFYGDLRLNIIRFSRLNPTVPFAMSSEPNITILNGKEIQYEKD